MVRIKTSAIDCQGLAEESAALAASHSELRLIPPPEPGRADRSLCDRRRAPGAYPRPFGRWDHQIRERAPIRWQCKSLRSSPAGATLYNGPAQGTAESRSRVSYLLD